MASPMAHQTGFMYGLMMPIMLQASAVLQDVWDPARAVELIRKEGATFTMASTPFLTDLTRAVSGSGEGVPSLETFLCAGAPIPGPLVQKARESLGAKIVSAWGMTENGAVTLIKPDDGDELAFTTDGCALPGAEVKVVDPVGETLPPGQVGKLLVRSCSNFGGYLKRPQWNATDPDGWFDTGDLARLDANGYIRIAGRTKDVIIRGGENIPVVEIEALLYKHPAVAQAAIVAYPDERLSERACAVVVPKPGQNSHLRRDDGIPQGAEGGGSVYSRTADRAPGHARDAIRQDSEVPPARDAAGWQALTAGARARPVREPIWSPRRRPAWRRPRRAS